MTRLCLAIGLMGALALSACSSKSNNPVADAGMDMSPDLPLVTISGTAAPHPLTTPVGMNPAGDFSQLVVAVVDPSVVLANPSAAPLAGGPLDTTTAANCGASGCAWSFDNVNIMTISLGLVGIIDDMRAAGSKVWLKTGTGAGAADFINAHKLSREPITDRRLFVVSKATEARLAGFSALAIPDSTIAAGTLETRGFMIGTVVSKLSQGATPVAGAVITTTDTRTTILYPSADFMSNGTSTASHGTFLVVPKPVAPPTSVVTTWNVTSPAGDTRVWTSLTAGTTPGTCFVILFAANETP